MKTLNPQNKTGSRVEYSYSQASFVDMSCREYKAAKFWGRGVLQLVTIQTGCIKEKPKARGPESHLLSVYTEGMLSQEIMHL